ncbi:large ribosomal subunit protein bL35m [Lampetra planeri]
MSTGNGTFCWGGGVRRQLPFEMAAPVVCRSAAGLLRAGLPAARRALCRRVLSLPSVRGPLLALPAAQPSPVGVHLRGLSTLLSGLRIGTAVSPSTQASIGALRVLGQNKVTGTLGQPPRRSLIYFSKGRGKRKTVKAVVKRFLRLDCGLWLRRQAGCKKRLWKKRKPRIRRLRQHVLCNKWQSKLLDKMVTDYWKRRKWYEDDPYQLYHERTNFRA